MCLRKELLREISHRSSSIGGVVNMSHFFRWIRATPSNTGYLMRLECIFSILWHVLSNICLD